MSRKILVINPNTSLTMTEDIRQSAESVKHADTEMTYVNPAEGPESIENYLDEFLAAVGVLEIIAKERDNYDAFIIACGDDPGLFGAREITDKPVVAIGQAPMLFTPLLGRKFTILGTWKGDGPRSVDKVEKYKLERLLASVIPMESSVLGSHHNHEALVKKMVALGKKAIEEDGAEMLVTTCAGLAGVHREVQKQLGIPVLEGISCAVKLVESMLDLGLHTTRVGQYSPLPETKPLKGFPGFKHLEFFE